MTETSSSVSGVTTDTGVISGGSVGLISGNNIQIGEGSGIVANHEDPSLTVITLVEWPAFTAVASLNTNWSTDTVMISMDSSGMIIFNSSRFERANRNRIGLAFGTWERSTVQMVELWDARTYVGRTSDRVMDMSYSIIIPWGVIASNPTGYTVAYTGGQLVAADISPDQTKPNSINFDAIDPAIFDVIYRGSVLYSQDQTDVPVTVWDNNGAVETIPALSATIDVLYMTANGNVYLELGQVLYSSATEARANLNTYVGTNLREPVIDNNMNAIIAAIIVTPEDTSLDITTAHRPKQGFENTGDEDLTNYYLLDGSRSLAGDMDASGFALATADLVGSLGT
jgi:hypothetical protein